MGRAPARCPKPPRWQRAALAALSLLLVLALLVPAHLALGVLEQANLQPAQIVGTLAMLGLLALLPSLLPRLPAAILTGAVLAMLLLVHLSFFGLVTFSGAGFSDEFFIHLEPRSVLVAWDQYPGLWLALLALLPCVALTGWLSSRHMPRLRRQTGWALAAVLVITTMASREGSPAWMLANAAQAWYAPQQLDLPEADLRRWRASGLVEIDLPRKSAIRARVADPPRNLVLIYLESLGQRVIEHPDHPGLMPNLARRLHEQSYLADYFSSGYITIEGIVNSQCGTLVPFQRGSESLAGFDGMADAQPCLGDVLHRAGYVQSFLGGAETTFAGKGAFLRAHGFDRVMGFAEWSAMGLAPRPGGWGLGDPDLFTQATAELERLRALDSPFNLTLLTIGTHLPGFGYAECRPYRDGGEPFLEALHCTDQLLERWLHEVEQAGHLEDTLVVITADHHVFPNPEMERLFGRAAVADKRLPLLVFGAGATSRAAVPAGASYDLAPTVLDLLGVEHDARFALGRSLHRPGTAREWFPTRYADVYRGNWIRADEACGTGELVPPLDRCGKDALKALLRMQNAAFSAGPAWLRCDGAEATRILIPEADGAPLAFLVAGEDQAARFTWKSRARREAQAGLFLARFTADGELVERRFIPAGATEALQPPQPADSQAVLLAWRGRPGQAAPAWLPGGATGGTAALVDAIGTIHALPRQAGKDGVEFHVDAGACARLAHQAAVAGNGTSTR